MTNNITHCLKWETKTVEIGCKSDWMTHICLDHPSINNDAKIVPIFKTELSIIIPAGRLTKLVI